MHVDPGEAAIAASLCGVFGLMLVAVFQNRHGHQVTNAKVDKIEHSVNHIEETPDPDGNGQVTLGQVVKGIATAQGAQGDAIHQVGQRVDGLRTDFTGLRGDFTSHIAAESLERQEIADRVVGKVEDVRADVETGRRDHVAVDGLRDATHVKVEIDKDAPTVVPEGP